MRTRWTRFEDARTASWNPQLDRVPGVTLPRGGGALRGLGEKFAVNATNGTGSLTVPVPTSPGRAGFGPELTLAYDSGSGNGIFGLGWSLGLPAVSRRTDKRLPTYRDADDEDAFLIAGADELVPELVAAEGWTEVVRTRELDGVQYSVRRYRPRVEGLFARVERWTEIATGSVHWRSTSPGNVTSVYGRNASARIADPARPSHVFAWLIEETFDDRGNIIRYEYKRETYDGVAEASFERNRRTAVPQCANRYPKRILYANERPFEAADFRLEVVFDYGEHDPAAPGPDEAAVWPSRPDPFSSNRAGFEQRTYRLCRRVLMFHRFPALGPEPQLVQSTDLTYGLGRSDAASAVSLDAVTQAGYLRPDPDGPYERETLPPLEFEYTRAELDGRIRSVDRGSLENLPSGVDGVRHRWVDLDGEGIPGVLTEQAGAFFYKRNLGQARFDALELVASAPATARDDGRHQVMSLAGDGRQYLVHLGHDLTGYHRREADGTWGPFVHLDPAPNVDWDDPDLRFADLSADGVADVLVADDDGMTVYLSDGPDAYGPPLALPVALDEEQGPRLVRSGEHESLHLADMSGDGLVDVVRCRNGEVAYWPSLGYGRFGPKVTMAGAPVFDHPDLFEPARLRLADVDGSGTTDVVYLGREELVVWRNQAGNRFAAPERLSEFPQTDDLTTVSVVDLLGTGTACVVWSSPLAAEDGEPLRYIDLLDGRKPRLLATLRNNMGAETRLQYASSTQMYLEDARAGIPWTTRLPFPVHVVARVESVDLPARTRNVRTFRYRHGYFDPEEREFRGFALVEETDADRVPAVSGGGRFSEPPPVDDDELRLPPTLTRTWFHVGAPPGARPFSEAHASELYGGDPLMVQLPDPVVHEDLGTDEHSEALRALKGAVLRQEVYALDDAPAAVHPYLVSQRSYRVEQIQPRGPNRHGSFWAQGTEALDYHYERDPSDPRIGHHVTLEADAFGNIRRSAAIGYPRRTPEIPDQAGPRVVVTDADFANVADRDDFYRIGLPVSVRTYELTGAAPASGALFSAGELSAAAATATEVAYHVEPPPDAVRKRLVESVQTVYYKDDLSGPLPLGQVESHGLPFQGYRMALPGASVTAVYGDRAPDELLAGEARHVLREGAWWVPSRLQVFDPARFFLPVQATSERGGVTRVGYDPHALLVTRIEDAVGNTILAENDYRTLLPRAVVDPNGNRSLTRTNGLGLVVATALAGKEGSADGDTLDDPTTRIEYRLFEWMHHRRPNAVWARARSRRGPGEPRWQETYTYVDGSGREVMKKVPAPPGPAPARGADGRLLRDASGAVIVADTAPARRWIGSGRTVFNNKGHAVKRYEPFFSSTPAFEDEADLVEGGVTAIMRYDPLGRLVETENPDGTISRTELAPWSQVVWDANDTVLESRWHADRQALAAGTPENDAERRADALATAHAGTPTTAQLDVLGRAVRVVQDNRPAGTLTMRTELDVEGNPRRMFDARGTTVVENWFDMLGRKLRLRSPDAGERWTVNTCTGLPIRKWDRPLPGQGGEIRLLYDPIDRPTHVYVRRDGGPEALVALTVYGELHPEAAARNLRGRGHIQFDGAGMVEHRRFDLMSNPVESRRRFARTYREEPDWSAVAGATSLAEVVAAADPLLEPEAFSTSSEFDALARPLSMTLADGSVVLPQHDESGLVKQIDVRIRGGTVGSRFVAHIAYNARGQRERLELGNGVSTEYTYDELSLQLTRLLTRGGGASPVLQDLAYAYDPVGNITEIRDGAQQSVFFANAVASPRLEFEYDPIYRLRRASGRELAGGAAPPNHADPPRASLPHANAAGAVRSYTRRYEYDDGGNLTGVVHTAPGGGWTREYAYAAGGNRLLATSLPGDPPGGPFSATYDHDHRGNTVRMPHLALIEWTFNDQLRRADLGGGGNVYYAYDATGARVRKVVERSPSLREETLDLGGVELHRRYVGDRFDAEWQALHVVDDRRRLAIVETTTRENGSPLSAPVPVVRYQIDNHLGSAVLELDAAGAPLSYEEYYPFGGTAYHSARGVAAARPKRQRFTGHKRDDETGLTQHGVRSYAPWLGRWLSCDPQGTADGPNPYAYVRNNPIRYSDPSGTETRDEELPNQVTDLLGQLSRRLPGGGGGEDGGGRSLFDVLGDAATSLWEGLKAGAGAVWSGIKAAASAVWSGIKAAAEWTAGAIKTAATAVWSGLKAAASWTWNAIKTAASAVWNAIKVAAGAVWAALKTAAIATARAVKAAAIWTWNAIKTAASFLARAVPAAIAFLWRWVLAPSIRTATNAIAGAALGFLAGGPLGALVGAGLGAATGAVHGWGMAVADSYDWKSLGGWALFVLDNTWSLPNSVIGSLFASTNIFWNPIDKATSEGSGQLYFKHGWSSDYDTTFGNVTVGTIVPTHEAVHGLQARIFGPLFYPLAIAGLAVALIPYWWGYHDHRNKKITGVWTYLKCGTYPHSWHEEWAYAVQGNAPC